VHTFLLERQPGEGPPGLGDVVLLGVEESHHLFHVLRQGQSEPLQLVDGTGWRFRGILQGKQGRQARVRIEAAGRDEQEAAAPQLLLVCAVARARRFEWLLEKAVELGAHEIRPVRTERSVVLPGRGRQERWQSLLRSALKQCGRAQLPRLQPAMALGEALADLADAPLLFGDLTAGEPVAREGSPGPAVPLLSARQLAWLKPPAEPLPGRWVWAVGPEGGWTVAERERLFAAGCPVSLGPHCLRTETAAIAGLAVLQALRSASQPEAAGPDPDSAPGGAAPGTGAPAST
jgi:16S rRNA (uracil1498-N3)-methyltransferase